MSAVLPVPRILLDPPGAGDPGAEVDDPRVARIRDVLAPEDLAGVEDLLYPERQVLRVHDLACLEAVERRGLDRCPVLVSHLVEFGDLRLPRREAGLLLEVASAGDLDRALLQPADVLVGRGLEAPGPAKECTAFVLFQLLKARADRPFFMHGHTGPELLEAYLAEGVAGVVLPADQFTREDTLGRFRFALGRGASLRLLVSGEEAELRELGARLDADPVAFLRETAREGRWARGLEDLGSQARLGAVARYATLAETSSRAPGCGSCFTEASLYSRRHGLRYPVIQGPLSRIAVRPAFAEAVAAAGAFPYLALAGLPREEARALVRATKATGVPFGVGLLVLADDPAAFEEDVRFLEEVRPDRVLVAAPRIDVVSRLLRTDLPLYVHAPTAAVFRAVLGMGVTRVVVEGEEAGGHVSTTSSLDAWQDVLAEVRSSGRADELEVVFAGGVAGPHATALLSSLLHAYGLADRLAVAVQLGTAYLATEEARAHTPVNALYQEQVTAGRDTVVTGETLRLRVRQVATDSVVALRDREWEIFREDVDLDEKRRRIEEGYLGTLSRALEREDSTEGASYMAGSAVALLEAVRPAAELHAALAADRPHAAPDVLHEPIAVVGLGARFPGCPDVPSYFRAALQQRCFIRDVPDRVWEREVFLSDDRDAELRSYSGIAGLVEEPEFDPAEFRIPPSVAARMDRAQRLALLAARDALADAGYLGGAFDRDRVGVMIANSMGGNAVDESQQAIHAARVRARLEAIAARRGAREVLDEILDEYDATYRDAAITEDTLPGELSSIIAGRVAWAFDLHGPNFTVDSACASTLAAVKIAVNALRAGECDMVLAGGVDTQVDAGLFVKFSKLTALSATGSFPFDDRGDGFVIGEGCGVLLLKRYRDALRDGDRVYALIRGVGSSSDGAGKGITAPRTEGQLKALRRAYADAGADPGELGFVECHGTGTPVGDVTELETVGGLGARAAGAPALPVGSAKAMVGHLKAAAGAAGLFRGLLALNAGVVPPQVNFERPNSRVDWEGLGLRVPARAEPLPADRPLVGVSSFGFGGTNYHAVLAPAPLNPRAPLVRAEDHAVPDVGPLAGDTALLFPGQGSQYVGMGAELRGDPVADALLARADAVFEELTGSPLAPVLYPPGYEDADEATRAAMGRALTSTEVAQPAIFVVSAILLEHARARGLAGSLVIGHSLGEYTALHAAGVLGFEDALRAVSIRGRLMGESGGEDPGAMAFVEAERALAEDLCDAVDGYVLAANLNAYEQTVVSGETAAVEALVARAGELGISARRLDVARAFHSELVAASAGPMRAALEAAPLRTTEVPIPANLSGQVYPRARPGEGGREMSPGDRARVIDLLTRQIAEPVDFVRQVEAAYAAGIRRFVEVGPKNVLARLVTEILQGKRFQALHLDHPREDPRELLEALPARLAEEVRIHRLPLPAAARPARAIARPRPAAPGPAATGTLEERVRAIVAHVSGYAPEKIGVDQDFERDLGIDTLKIFEIFSRLRGEVLPADVQNFRELTSLGRILEAARGTVPPPRPPGEVGEDAGEAPGGFRVRQLQLVRVGSIAGDRPVPDEYGYRVLLDDTVRDRTALLGQARHLEDQGSRDFLVVIRAPESSTDLTDRVLPDLHDTVIQCADVVEKTREDHSFHLVSLGKPGGFDPATFHAVAAFVRSAQKDVPRLHFSFHHLEDLRPDADTLRRVLATPSLARRIHGDGTVEEARLVPTDLAPAEPGKLGALLGADDVVLVTGGARGITARIVQALLEVTEARFLLLGRTSHVDEWIAGNPRVEYLRCDLRDPESVRGLRLAARGVTLLVHAAGYEVSRNLKDKPSYEVAQVLGVKIRGLEYLLHWLDGEKLRGVVHFSSIAAFFGNHGQADYAAANGYLNGARVPGVPTVSIGWSAWGEIGMAARGRTKEILEAAGVEFLPVDLGVEIFERILAELLGEPRGERVTLAVMGAVGEGFLLPEDRILESPRRSLGRVPLVTEGRRESFAYRFDLKRSPYLRDHRINEDLYLPAVSILRQFMKKAAEVQELVDARFTDLRFLSPVVFRDGQEQTFSVENRGAEYLIETSRGKVTTPVVQLGFRTNLLGIEDATEAEEAWDRMRGLLDRWLVPYEPVVHGTPRAEIYKTYFHGRAFQVLEALTRYNGFVLEGKVNLADQVTAGNAMVEYGSVAYLLEAVFHTSGLLTLIDVDCGYFYIPHSVERVDVFYDRCKATREARVVSEILAVEERMRFDAVVVDQDDEVLLHVKGLEMAKSREEVPHKKAILVPSSPVILNGADVFLVDLAEAARHGAAHEGDLFTPAEREEIAGVTADKRKREKRAGKLAAKILAREVLRREVRQEYGLETFEVLAPGKPVDVAFLGAPHLDPLLGDLSFSISHGGTLAVAAAGRGRVGVDVEPLRPLPPEVVRDVLGERGQEQMEILLERFREDPRLDELYRQALPLVGFTAKEAVVKAAGVGIGGGLDGVELERLALSTPLAATFQGERYRVLTIFDERHVLSVARLDPERQATGIPSGGPG